MSNTLETGVLSKTSPNGVVQHCVLFYRRRAPHSSLQMAPHAGGNPTKSCYSLLCSWCGLRLVRSGEIRCAAAMKCFVCAIAFYGPSSRATSLGIFHCYCHAGKC